MNDINDVLIALCGAASGLGVAWFSFKGKHEDSLTSTLSDIRKSNQQLLEDYQELNGKISELLLLTKEMSMELKLAGGKDYSAEIEKIMHKA
ncbi:hypothetical protein ACT5YR_07460 [Fructobacillus fructosus]|uniref:hypothetical protein n=1 Tax=Fructobacillus fructosus TaxID=1631 RepID=UPI0040342CC0